MSEDPREDLTDYQSRVLKIIEEKAEPETDDWQRGVNQHEICSEIYGRVTAGTSSSVSEAMGVLQDKDLIGADGLQFKHYRIHGMDLHYHRYLPKDDHDYDCEVGPVVMARALVHS